MKQLIKLFFNGLVLTLLLIAHSAYAEFILVEEGAISTISRSKININDSQFRLSPTVKVTIMGKKKGQLKDIKRGDYARISVIKINKRKLVDSINIIKKPNQETSNDEER